MAALNISHELLTQGEGSNLIDNTFATRLKGIQEKIEDALYKSQQIEI